VVLKTVLFTVLAGAYVLACSSCQALPIATNPPPAPSDSAPAPVATLADGGACASACDRARETPCKNGQTVAPLAHCLAVCNDAVHSVSGPTVDCVARIATCDEVCPR
jgi:hypothetical protein